MKHNLIIKGITLTCFITLIGIFLIYRSGRFNSFFSTDETPIQSSHNGGKITITRTTGYDSAQYAKISSSKSFMMNKNASIITNEKNKRLSSSKSLVMIDDDPILTSKKNSRLSSSKSIVMVDDDPFIISQKKRAYLSYMLTYRPTYFQDSLRRSANTLPIWLQLKLDSIKLNSKNWYYTK